MLTNTDSGVATQAGVPGAGNPSIPGTYTSNIPGAFGANGYADANLAANTAYKNALARINQKRLASLRQSGYLGDIDPNNGTVGNLRVDPNNPFGGLQQMLRSQAGDFQQAQFAAEDRGLHGGLAHKADSELKYEHGGQAQQFGQAITDALGGLQDEQNQAAYTRDSALADAERQATEDAIANQAFNQGDYTGLDYPDYGTDPGANPPRTVVNPRAAKVISKVSALKKATVSAKKVTANKTGATVQKGRGVISTH